jgi:hypothetical protein
MLVEIATPSGDLVVHFGNSVLDRHSVSWPPCDASVLAKDEMAGRHFVVR